MALAAADADVAGLITAVLGIFVWNDFVGNTGERRNAIFGA